MIAFCAAPVQSYALPPCHYEHNTYCGEDIYEPGSLEASYVDYVQGVWKCDTRLAKKGALCGRWSNSVRKTFSSSMKEINYYGLRFNEKNFLAKCKGCKAGTKLVLGQAKYENGTLSHAIILFKVTANEVWWADCNWNHDNVVHYRHGTVKDFVNFYHYKKSKYSYLHFIVKINSYRHYSTPKIASANTVTDGTARIVWTKTSGAEKYRVYRSASKGGEYSCVAETAVCSYKDTAAEAGKTYYYKVAAVDKSGKSCGILQITPILVKECNRILELKKRSKRYTMNDRFSAKKSKEMFLLYQSFYNPKNSVELAIRSWNGGINYTVKGTQRYFEKVMSKMK